MKPQMIKTLWISAVVLAALIGTVRFMKKNDYANYGRDKGKGKGGSPGRRY